MFGKLPFLFRILIELFCKPKERYIVTSWISWYNELSNEFEKELSFDKETKTVTGVDKDSKLNLLLKYVKDDDDLNTIKSLNDKNIFVWACFFSQLRYFHLNVYYRKLNPKYFYQKDQKKISESIYEMCKLNDVEVKVGVFLQMDDLVNTMKKYEPFIIQYNFECVPFDPSIQIPKDIHKELLEKIQNDDSKKSLNRLCKRTLMSYFKLWCFFNTMVSEHYDSDNEYFVSDEYYDFLNLICAPPKANIKDENSMPYFKDKKFSKKIFYIKQGDLPTDRDTDSYYYDFNDSVLDNLFNVYSSNMFHENFNSDFYDAFFMCKCAKFFFTFVNEAEFYEKKHIYIYNLFDIALSEDFNIENSLSHPYYTFFYVMCMLNYLSNDKDLDLTIN